MVYFDSQALKDIPNLDLILKMSEALKTSVVLTGADLEQPGPFISYVNPAFTEMTGYKCDEVIGRSPRMLQKGVRRTTFFRGITEALTHRRRFHGVLENARANGERYYCEVDINPLFAADGSVGAFIAFEREAVRRKGRPAAERVNRFAPLLQETLNEVPGTFGAS